MILFLFFWFTSFTLLLHATTTDVPTTTSMPVKLIQKHCIALAVSSYDTRSDDNGNVQNVTTSATVKMSTFNDTHNTFTVENFSFSLTLNSSYTVMLCASTDLTWCKNISESMDFIASNNVIDLVVSVTKMSSLSNYELFYGIIDSGSFISIDGSLMDISENVCTIYGADNSSYEIKSCCTEASEITAPDTYTRHPKCQNYKAISTLHNATDNSVYAGTYANLFLNETGLYVNQNYSNLLFYTINGYVILDRFIDIVYNNSEFIIASNFGFGFSTFAGRIILLDGQTLIEQGIPYTFENSCLNTTESFHDPFNNVDIFVINQFCCEDFLTDETTATVSSSSLSTTALVSSSNAVSETATQSTIKPTTSSASYINFSLFVSIISFINYV